MKKRNLLSISHGDPNFIDFKPHERYSAWYTQGKNSIFFSCAIPRINAHSFCKIIRRAKQPPEFKPKP